MKKMIGLGLFCAAAGLCISALRKKQRTEQKALYLTGSVVPDPNKKAILVVSFGTSYADTREKTIGAIEEDFRRAFPDYTVRRAFTSGMIIKKLRQRDGLEIDTVEQALQKLYDEGYGTVICQPTHVMNGFEFDDVRQEVARWEDRFPHIICGWPLLTSFEDYRLVVDALLKEFAEIAKDDSTALVLMGHGTEHPANATYPALDYRLKAEGCCNFFIGTVEGYPDLQTVMKEVAGIHAKKVVLAPLMVVAGDHAVNDMCGNEDSWQHLFERAGYQTEAVLKGLGEYPSFRAIYVAHCQHCIEELEKAQEQQAAAL